MKPLLNTLYVTTQGAYLAKDGEAVAVRVDKETKLHIPVHNLGSIVCFGQVSCSPFLLGLCAERGVTVAFLTEHGRFLARVCGPTTGNVLLRREQYRRADDAIATAAVTRSLVGAKVANSRYAIQRALRDRPSVPGAAELVAAVRDLSRHLDLLRDTRDLEVLRGIEGSAARVYFGVFDHLIAQQKEAFFFRERTRRPPLDSMNALLSFVYTLVRHDIVGGLESVGLDPAVGFLHRDRPGRPSLALDLLEEFRPYLADRLVLGLVNLRQVSERDFEQTESGGVIMRDGARKSVVVAYQKRKQEEVVHPFLGERVAVGLLFHLQALLLARYLRGDLDAYPAFIAK